MYKKLIFLVLFVPLHLFSTVLLLHYFWYNYNARLAGPFAQVAHAVAAVLAVPLLAMLHVVGVSEHSPTVLQILFLVGNSLLWGVAVLLIYAGIHRLFGRHAKAVHLKPRPT